MDFEKFISPEIIEFVVGPAEEEKSYYINKHFISRLSSTLNALLSGGMRESLESRVVFRELDPQTFVHVAAYAVTGRYCVGQNVFDGPSSRKEEEKYEDAVDNILIQETLNESGDPGPSKRPSITITTDGRSDATGEIDGDELLQHAKLYVFADAYDVIQLKEEAYLSIDVALNCITVDGAASTVRQVVDLVRYAYQHTLDEPEERLRSRLSRFCARNIRVLVLFREFSELQTEGGSFAVDLMNHVLQQTPVTSPGGTVRGFPGGRRESNDRGWHVPHDDFWGFAKQRGTMPARPVTPRGTTIFKTVVQAAAATSSSDQNTTSSSTATNAGETPATRKARKIRVKRNAPPRAPNPDTIFIPLSWPPNSSSQNPSSDSQ